MNILVSGIAGDIGFGVGRILRSWGWSGQLFGTDMHSEHPGEFIFDQTSVAPRANDPFYLEWLTHHIEHHKIGLFIPTSEAEIDILSKQDIRGIASARILLANQKSISVSLDKRQCMCFLEEHGLRVPKNGVVGVTTPVGYPVIIKPRVGQGSKQFQKINNVQEFVKLALPGFVWQEYLAPDNEEFTCPVYHSANLGTHILVLRRHLMGGLTSRGEVVNNPQIEEYVSEIARTLKLDGAINVQLRLTKDGPCLFEINPRLSGTLVFRDKMGFFDLRWWIQDTVGRENTPLIPIYAPPKPGTRFFRGSHEYITTT